MGNDRYWNVFAIVDGRIVVKNTITSSPDVSYIPDIKSSIMMLELDDTEKTKDGLESPTDELENSIDIGNKQTEIKEAE